MRLARIVWLLVVATSGGAAQRAPSNRASYEFPFRYDAEIAAPMVHRVRYADDHIMLLEVANPPGYPMQMHGHPYPSVFARSSGRTSLGGLGPREQYLEPGVAGTANIGTARRRRKARRRSNAPRRIRKRRTGQSITAPRRNIFSD
ncbi:hypothetical protein QP179_06090 [Sphingomonas aurantiaca]|uniref:hypothetical protein n=1 Tax=Sphingomonas aurantiaca TaxID=185949 RepID=UPI002FDFBB3F